MNKRRLKARESLLLEEVKADKCNGREAYRVISKFGYWTCEMCTAKAIVVCNYVDLRAYGRIHATFASHINTIPTDHCCERGTTQM